MPSTKERSGEPKRIVFSPDEVKEWNEQHPPDDQMAPWVCAIGGYEMLQEGNAKLAIQWWTLFGHRAHGVIRGGPFLARETHRMRGQVHYGFLWWGSPNSWSYRWPSTWDARLGDEAWKRIIATKMLLPRDVAVLESLKAEEEQ